MSLVSTKVSDSYYFSCGVFWKPDLKPAYLFSAAQPQQIHRPSPKSKYFLRHLRSTILDTHRKPHLQPLPASLPARWARSHRQWAGRTHCSMVSDSCRRHGCSRKVGNLALTSDSGELREAGRQRKEGLLLSRVQVW